MSTPYIGEIRMFGGNFAPAGWHLCDGSLLPISEYDALFTLIGTTYGGDRQNTFALPDLRGRIPVHMGNGKVLGQMLGSETVTLTAAQMPSHSHSLLASGSLATGTNPQGNVLARTAADIDIYRSSGPYQTLAQSTVSSVGGSQPHENMMPFLAVNFIISLFGIFPSQT
ncbi:phage tail protein [Halopseudomonas phragmitis]|uniref:Phage tail protein n=1 Tax=Halopseudomonas phragmitis TaxID=1931241 RepID=A0A1V0B1E0_9GAMM|nr:tail fiber protein [Halopseudomonas phragmitis]AQZ93700.1 phage tail protein [Halopseudomonas phragmitis]